MFDIIGEPTSKSLHCEGFDNVLGVSSITFFEGV
jgi:hypothetical protein